MTGFILRWKATQRGYNQARFRLDSFFYYDMRASRDFVPMLKHGANICKLISWLVSIHLPLFLVSELQIVPSLRLLNFVSIRSLGEICTQKPKKRDKNNSTRGYRGCVSLRPAAPITMDTSQMDATFQVEASDLPQAESIVEARCCDHPFKIEHDDSLWKLSAFLIFEWSI